MILIPSIFQPECYLNFLVLIPCLSRLTGVVSMSLLSPKILVLAVFLVSSFYRRASILFVSLVPFLPSFSTSQDSLISLICPTRNFVFLFLFRLVPKILGRDLLLVEESCNAPRATLQLPFHLF